MAAEDVDWFSYFESIKSVCPWSRGAWQKNQIDIQYWNRTVLPLAEYRARVYIYHTSPRLLKKITGQLNEKYSQEEWLWSHPRYKQYSTPVGVLIQQDRTQLETIRKNLNLDSLDK